MEKSLNSFLFLISVIVIFFFMNVRYVHSYEAQDANYRIQMLETERIIDSLEYEIRELKRYQDSVERYKLNWDNISYWLNAFDVKHVDIAKQQIFLETGNLSSDICENNNNLFGMRYPRVRHTTAIGVRKAHAKYDNFVESIRDYAIWQNNMYDGSSDYHAFLERVGYAECVSYINKLKYIERNELV